ncbi:MAG: nucleoside deaminase [Proteobacteria bacterium]|nr:nucleoside deaminase [Pseudomonadota bacterium]
MKTGKIRTDSKISKRGDRIYPKFDLKLPHWLEEYISDPGKIYPAVEDRMKLVVELSRLNVVNGTGGPFGAGIFDMETKRLLAPGVNLVESSNVSIFHAEVVAIILAQLMVGQYDLGGEGMPRYELVASTEPCAMCFGAIPWSGVRQLVCGARDEDARRIGFDEGPKMENWSKALKSRGIDVIKDVCRDEAVKVLTDYLENAGLIYNSRSGN